MKDIMKFCLICGEELGYLPFNCKRCGGKFCSKHRLPENHDCTYEFEPIRARNENLRKLKGKKSLKSYRTPYNSRGYPFRNKTTIISLLMAGIIFGFIAVFSPAGMHTMYSIETYYTHYSEVRFIWYFGGYLNMIFYDGGYDVVPYSQGIDMKMLFIGITTTLLLLGAIFLIIRTMILLEKKKIPPKNARISMIISGFTFIFTPILWFYGNILIDSSISLYSQNILLFWSFIGGALTLIAVLIARNRF